MKCNNWDCLFCRWGECVGDREATKEFGWCDRTEEEKEESDLTTDRLNWVLGATIGVKLAYPFGPPS